MIHSGRRYRVTWTAWFTHVTPTLREDGLYDMTWDRTDGKIFVGVYWSANDIEFALRDGGLVEDEVWRVEQLLKEYE